MMEIKIDWPPALAVGAHEDGRTIILLIDVPGAAPLSSINVLQQIEDREATRFDPEEASCLLRNIGWRVVTEPGTSGWEQLPNGRHVAAVEWEGRPGTECYCEPSQSN